MARLRRRENPGGDGVGRRAVQKASDLARSEFTLAFPAAKRAATHAARAFLKKFSEEYARERRKKRK